MERIVTMTIPFSQKTLEFLFENRLHDSRSWFAEHKRDYQTLVLEPLRQLVQELSPTMLELDPQFQTEPKVDKTICRIWRDTRYTKDPSSIGITCGSSSNGAAECTAQNIPACILKSIRTVFLTAAVSTTLPPPL